MCPELDSNQHARSAQPPQDCVSTNFTTWAYRKYNFLIMKTPFLGKKIND